MRCPAQTVLSASIPFRSGSHLVDAMATKNAFWTHGLPFLTFMVVGLQGLAYVTQGRYDVS